MKEIRRTYETTRKINIISPQNEGTRLVQSIRYERKPFGKITHIVAEDIYTTN
ncbi:MAG: hypothetical protein GX999_09340 [Bacteroidales bacterium]|nr:hypothetical protein [Bacteroidales bacterium]